MRESPSRRRPYCIVLRYRLFCKIGYAIIQPLLETTRTSGSVGRGSLWLRGSRKLEPEKACASDSYDSHGEGARPRGVSAQRTTGVAWSKEGQPMIKLLR